MTIELKIDEKKAREIYPGASKEVKEILEASAPKDFFSMKITDRVKTFEDVLALAPPSENSKILLLYNGADPDMIGAQAMLKLTLIVRALNEGWTPDWSNSSQYKYYPYFKKNPAGFGFSDYDCDSWYAYALCGSRLCFKSAELAVYAGKQFLSIYNDFLNNQ